MNVKRHAPSIAFPLRPIACCVLLACCDAAWANPTGPAVAAGAATFQSAGGTLSIKNAPGTIINWQGFSIGSAEHTRFLQQSASSAVLNRVVGSDMSSILGSLTSNGRVFLVNPHGIVFGAGARIDTAGFIASTLNIADKDFLQGKLKFEGGGSGVLRNEGAIRASGDIMLVGPTIENAGAIVSDHGSVLLAAGRKVTITSPDAQGVRFELQAPSDSALNVGTIDAASSVAMFAGTLRHSGEIRATGASVGESGKVTLVAQKEAVVDKGAVVTASGLSGGAVTIQSGDLTMVSGHVDATGTAGHGGTIQILGNRVGLDSGASIDASGETGGGTILVGGDYQGKNPDVQNAWRTYVAPEASLRADAVTSGDGGKVIVWADDINRYYGNISARGGSQAGDGGFVEVSGKRVLDFNGHVDTRAPKGHVGTLLLDPTTINIVGADDPGVPNTPLAAQIFQDVANDTSEITVANLVAALVTSDVTINTTSSSLTGAGDINFNAPFDFNSTGITRTLTLVANRDVNFFNPIFDSNPALDRLNLRVNASGAVNIASSINLRGGFFDARTFGSGVVNMTSGNPALNEVGAFSAGTLNIAGVTVALNATTTNVGTLAVSGGTLNAAGAITVDSALNWSGGTITGPGLLTTVNGSTSGVTGPVTLIDKTWENFGAATFSGTGALTLAGTGGLPTNFINRSGGNLTLNTASVDPVINVGTAAPNNRVFNEGTLNASAPGPVEIAAPFNNSNTVNVTDGRLVLSGPGSDIGAYDIAGGTVLEISGARTFSAASAPSGAGALLLSGGSLDVLGGTLARLAMTGGTLTRSTAGDLTISGGFGVSGGSITAGGGGNLVTSGTVGVSGVVNTTRNWLHTGSMELEFGGQITRSGGNASITNEGSIVLNTASPNPLGTNAAAPFVNRGELRKVLSALADFPFPFANETGGTVSVEDGGIRFGNSGTHSGTFTVFGANLIEFAGGVNTLNPSASLLGDGRYSLTGGTLDVRHGNVPRLALSGTGALTRSNAGDITIAGPFLASGGTIAAGSGNFVTQGATVVSGALNVGRPWLNEGVAQINVGASVSSDQSMTNAAGGVLGGAGNIDLAGRTLTNNGILRPGSTIPGGVGTLGITGNLTQGPNGRIEVDLSGLGPTQSDRLAITGSADLRGTLAVALSDGFAPPSDSNYTIMTYASRSGDFATKIFPVGYDTFAGAPGADYQLPLGAVTNRWIGGSGLWQDSDNWNLTHVPTPGEDALIDVGGPAVTATITVSAGNQLARRVTSQENLTVAAGGALTMGPLASVVNAALTVSGGALTLNGPLTANSITLSSGILDVGVGTLPRLDMTGGLLMRSIGGDLTITGPFNVSGGFIAPSAVPGSFITSGNTTVTGVTTSRDWSNTGVLDLNGGLELSGANFTNDPGATFNVNGGGQMSLGGAVLTNRGTLNLNTAATNQTPFGTLSGGAVLNSGTVNKNLPGFVNLFHPFTNAAAGTAGNVNVNDGTLSAAFGGSQSGNIEIAPGATLNTDGSLANSGTIGGRGSLQLFGGTLTNSGTVRPGTRGGTTGTLTITGNFANTPAGQVNVRLGGQADEQFDKLVVTGTANLGGTLNLSTTPAYTATDGDTFTILGAATVAGDFATTTKTFANGANVLNRPTFYLVGLGAPTVNSWIFDSEGSWTDVSRWSLGHTPLANEQVFINRPTSLSVTIPAGTFAADSLRSTENVFLGGTLDLAKASSIDAVLSITPGGVLQGTGPVTVSSLSLNGAIASTGGVTVTGITGPIGNSQITGLLTVNELQMVNGGSLSIARGGTLALRGTAVKQIGDGTLNMPTLNNAGLVTLAGSNLTLNGARVNNTGRFDIQGDVGVQSAAGPLSTFNNSGRLAKTSGGGTSTIGIGPNPLAFVNSGTLDAETGTLRYAATNTFGDGTTFTGPGAHVVAFDSTFNGAIASTDLTLESGLFGGTASFPGTLMWTGGIIAGAFTVPGGATFNVTGAGIKTIDGPSATLRNAGTANIGGTGSVVLSNGGQWDNFGTTNLAGAARFSMSGAAGATTLLVNRTAGVIDDSSSAETLISGAAGTSFVNAGTFNKNVAAAQKQTIDAPMTNTGDIEVKAGTLTASAFSVNSGIIDVAGGAIFSTGGADLTNASSGLLMGTGTFDVGGATLVNNGVVAPANSPGTLTIAGNFEQGPGGTLLIDLGGTRQGVDYDLLRITGSANLDGTLAVNVPAGASIATGSDFDFMTYASHTGNFATTRVPPGFRFQSAPGATGYGLIATAPSPPTLLTDEAKAFPTKDALVFGDRFTDRTTPRGDPGSRENAELERREPLPECR